METVFKRWFALISGLIIFALGLAFIIQANLGLGPWDVLHQGLSRLTGIPIGAVSIPVGLLIMLAWLPLGQRPGWGTLVNVVLIGVVIDLTLAILPHVEDMPIRGLLLAGGIIVAGVGSGLYLSANIGAGPRDGLMLGLAQRTGWSVRRVRTLLELIALVSGWLLGGAIGIGTVAFAFGIGPVVQVALRVFAGSGEGVKG
jgi:uncharacterized membrane protein YczE